MFYAANKLYGLTFKERHDLPVYQPDVRVFTVYDKDDPFSEFRISTISSATTKAAGAWMSNFVNQLPISSAPSP